MVMEAVKSHNLPSAHWRTREARRVIQSWSEGPRTRSSDGQGQEEGYPISRREKECALCLFVLFGPSTNWRVDLYSIY